MNCSMSATSSYSSIASGDQYDIDNIDNRNALNCEYDMTKTMSLKGYVPASSVPISKTLQGSIWRCRSTKFNQQIVIKVASKKLYAMKLTILNGSAVNIEENIVSEMQLLHYISVHGIYLG